MKKFSLTEVVEIVHKLSSISKNYDNFIIDQWGVMHDGKKGFTKAINCVGKLYQEKKEIIIISHIFDALTASG